MGIFAAFSRTPRRSPTNRRQVRPVVEALEVREVLSPSIQTFPGSQTLLPNQVLSSSGNVTVSDPNPATSLTWNANYGTPGYLAAHQLPFNLVPTSNYIYNWSGISREKWVQDTNGTWYFILPSGAFYQWTVGTTTPSGTLIANLDPIYYWNPNWLTGANNPNDSVHYQRAMDEATFVEDALQLQNPDTSSGYLPNFYGANELWLRGIDTSGIANWFYILPSGALYEWNHTGGATAANGWLMANLNPMYAQPDMLRHLTTGSGTLPTVSFASNISNTYSNTLTVTPSNYRGEIWIQAQVSESNGSTGYSSISQLSYVDLVNGQPTPTLSTPATQLVKSGTQTSFNLSGSVATGNTGTYTVGFAPSGLGAPFLSNSLPALTYESAWNSWGGAGTRWFLGGGNWYVLTQSGAFFLWQGSGWAGGRFLGYMPADYISNPIDLQSDTNATAPVGGSVTVNATGQVTVNMPFGYSNFNFAIIASLSDGMSTAPVRFLISVQ